MIHLGMNQRPEQMEQKLNNQIGCEIHWVSLNQQLSVVTLTPFF